MLHYTETRKGLSEEVSFDKRPEGRAEELGEGHSRQRDSLCATDPRTIRRPVWME